MQGHRTGNGTSQYMGKILKDPQSYPSGSLHSGQAFHCIIISTHDVGHCEISRSPVTALLGETFTGAHLTRSVTPRMVGQRFISSNSATEIRAAVLGNIRKGFTLTIAADLGAKDWAGEDKW